MRYIPAAGKARPRKISMNKSRAFLEHKLAVAGNTFAQYVQKYITRVYIRCSCFFIYATRVRVPAIVNATISALFADAPHANMSITERCQSALKLT